MNEDLNLKANQEIENALKDFEENKTNIQEPKISSEIDVLKSQKIEINRDSDMSGMVKFIIKHSNGIIKEQKQAEYLLIVLIITMFLISFYLFFK